MSLPYSDRHSRKRKAEQVDGAVNDGSYDGHSKFHPPLQKRLKNAVVYPIKFLSDWILRKYHSKSINASCDTGFPAYSSSCAQTEELSDSFASDGRSEPLLPIREPSCLNTNLQEHCGHNGNVMRSDRLDSARQSASSDAEQVTNGVTNDSLDGRGLKTAEAFVRQKRQERPLNGHAHSQLTAARFSGHSFLTNGNYGNYCSLPRNAFRVPTPITTLVGVGSSRNRHDVSMAASKSAAVHHVLQTMPVSQSDARDRDRDRDRASQCSTASVTTNPSPFRPNERDKFRQLLQRVTAVNVSLAESNAAAPSDLSRDMPRAPRYSFETGNFLTQMDSTRIGNRSRASSVSTQVISSGNTSPTREENTLRDVGEAPRNAFRERLLASPYVDLTWLHSITRSETERATLQRQVERESELQRESRRAREVLRVAYAGQLRQRAREFDQEDEEQFAQRFEKVSMFLNEPPSIEEYEKLLRPPQAPAIVSVDEFVHLPDDAEQLIRHAFRGAPDEVLVEGFRLQLKRSDLVTLAGLNWLNDEVINFYMQMIVERSEKAQSENSDSLNLRRLPKVYSFNTFFYPKLMSGGHAALKRWTKKLDLFEYDIILVPVHMQVHWCLAVIDLRSKIIRYYDSMGGPNPKCLRALLDYLDAEHREKKQTSLDSSNWQLQHADVPQQENGSDCGMFACKFADFAARDAPIVFSQENMPYYRKRMVYEILNKRFLDAPP